MLRQLFSWPMASQDMMREGVDERLIEFLIIPRFLISKEKIVKFINDENLQKNILFLVYHGCLGHYNNESNKKLPEKQEYMNQVRLLL